MDKDKIKSLKVLNIAQPNAHYIFHSGKNIENRTMITSIRGTVAIYASKTFSAARFEDADVDKSDCEFGVILGFVDIVDCITEDKAKGRLEKWFFGPYGYVLENSILLSNPIEVSPPKGAITWWDLAGSAKDLCLEQIRISSFVELYKADKEVLKLSGKKAPRAKLIPSKVLADIIGDGVTSFKKALVKITEYAEEKGLAYDDKTMTLTADSKIRKLCKMDKVTLQELVDIVEANLEIK